MPTLHVQFNATTVDPQGQLVNVPPPMVLKSHGPRVQVEIGIHQVFATELQSQNVALPSAHRGTALVDIGASVTCVDSDLASSMGLPIVDVVTMASASHAGTPANVLSDKNRARGIGLLVRHRQDAGGVVARSG